ncbi:MAG: tetratricopeptide repeat protein [bacterium]
MKSLKADQFRHARGLVEGGLPFAALFLFIFLVSLSFSCRDTQTEKTGTKKPEARKEDNEKPRLASLEPHLAAARELDPDPVGKRLMETGNYEKAADYYQGLMSRKPDDITACIGQGQALCMMGKTREALSAYTECAHRHPESSPVYVARGLCKQMSGGNFKTPPERDFQKAISIDPSNSSAHNQLGLVYQAKGELQDAEDEFRMAIAYEPDFFVAYNNLAIVLISRGKYGEAISLLQKAISFKADLREMYLYTNLGIAFLKSGKTQRAEAAFLMETAINPQHLPAHLYLGNLYVLNGRYQDAIQEYKRVLLSKPENRQALINLGATYIMTEDHQNAIKILKKAARLYPDSALVHFHLARAYRKTGRNDNARKEMQKARDLGYSPKPDSPQRR